VQEIFDKFEFHAQIERLGKRRLLYQVTQQFANIDLGPKQVNNHQMGLIFEELARKFADLSHGKAPSCLTPMDVSRLMVELLFIQDCDALAKPGVVRTIYDPAVGIGGTLSIACQHLTRLNDKARLLVFGQELNAYLYAICKAGMLIRGQDVANIKLGNTLSHDLHSGQHFDYMLSNPPFAMSWMELAKQVREEHEEKGHLGRFGSGLPTVSDGSLLFLLHLISKMRRPEDGGSRFGIGIVLSASSLFAGEAGSGESEIRRYVLENDLLEAIIGLPKGIFYDTGIATYIWIISNRKPEARKGKVQLIDARACWQKIGRSLGSKRKELSEADVVRITSVFRDFVEDGKEDELISWILRNEDFGYRTITIERPLVGENGEPVLRLRGMQKGHPQPDSKLRDYENVPLAEDVNAYFDREVRPHAPNAWINHEETKVGYEIQFNRQFYVLRKDETKRSQDGHRGRALIIATSQYSDPRLHRLAAPSADAVGVREVLSDPLRGNFDVTECLDKPCQTWRQTIVRFFNASPSELLLLYISGHGVKDRAGKLYFAAADTHLDELLATGVPASYIQEAVGSSRSRRVVLIFDTCYSGQYVRGLLPSPDYS
jgi:type I restriction enzyme M protein